MHPVTKALYDTARLLQFALDRGLLDEYPAEREAAMRQVETATVLIYGELKGDEPVQLADLGSDVSAAGLPVSADVGQLGHAIGDGEEAGIGFADSHCSRAFSVAISATFSF